MFSEDSPKGSAERNILKTQPLSKFGVNVIEAVKVGPFATVWQARTKQNQTVALKVMRKDVVKKAMREKFLSRELRILATLQHPNTVRLFQIIETARSVYLTMEYFERDVAHAISASKRLVEPVAAKWFLQLIAAITYLHSRGIAHRDLKCENMMLDKNDDVRVVDFGFARLVERDELSKTFCGTTSYAAPEVLSGLAYDPRKADLWSAGVVLYVMVVGSEPFDIPITYSLAWMANRMRTLEFRHADVRETLRKLVNGLLQFEENRYALSDIAAHEWTLEASARFAERGNAQCASLSPRSMTTAIATARSNFDFDEPTLVNGTNNELSLRSGNVKIPLFAPAILTQDGVCPKAYVTLLDVSSTSDQPTLKALPNDLTTHGKRKAKAKASEC